ncbi:hypothetical protein B0T19DRAFT_334397, partial [Cercophora scortea]
MRIPPAEIWAGWPKPNYDNPITRGNGLIAIEITIFIFALTILLLRLYVRIRILRHTGYDDWIMVAAMCFGMGVTISTILASTLYGWDRHVYDIRFDTLIKGRQISMAIQALFVLSSYLAKLSILVSYLRLAPIDSWFRRLTNVAIVTVVLACVGAIILLFSQCVPVKSYWDIFSGSRHCLPEAPPLLVQAILTVTTDFIVWVLPLPTFYHARLPLGQRIALIVLFSFGLFVVVAACARTYWIWYVLEDTYDPTWEGYNLWTWTAVEVHLGVVCGCVPWLKSLFKIRSLRGGSTGASNTGMQG